MTVYYADGTEQTLTDLTNNTADNDWWQRVDISGLSSMDDIIGITFTIAGSGTTSLYVQDGNNQNINSFCLSNVSAGTYTVGTTVATQTEPTTGSEEGDDDDNVLEIVNGNVVVIKLPNEAEVTS
ncbi:MAG: hypothetical protein LUG26_05115 [Ruminococcus sp.]|nr:hypothetical protein [Ruminococcus sp.]